MKKTTINIVSIFPKFSALWNYGFFVNKHLSKNKNFDVNFIDLWRIKKYHNKTICAISLMNGIRIRQANVLILVSPILSKSLIKSNATLKIVIAHDFYPITFKKNVSLLVRLLAKNTYKHINEADIILPVSDSTMSEAINLYGMKSKMIKINGGINHNIFKKQGLSKEKLRKSLGLRNKTIFLHVGRDDYRKNFRFVIKLFKRLNIDNKFLLKVGDISRSDRNFMIKSGIDDTNSRVISNISENDLNRIYNASDILLFPSLYEGLGLPPIEAMACGLPVVAAKNTGLKEACIPESLEELNIIKWKNKIKKILNNKDFKEDIIKKGLNQSEKFDWEKYSRIIEKIILRRSIRDVIYKRQV